MLNIRMIILSLCLLAAGTLSVMAGQKNDTPKIPPYIEDTDIHTLCKAWENGEITIFIPDQCLALGYDPDKKYRKNRKPELKKTTSVLPPDLCKTIGGCIPRPPKPFPCRIPKPCPLFI